MTTSPILGLTLMTASQAQKETVFNQFLIAMDALFRGSVLDTTLTAPPGSPALGDSYIVAASPTGAWSGHAHQVTFYFNGWQFVTPPNKLRLYSVAQSEHFVFDSGSSSWVAEPASTVSVLGDLTNVTGAPTNGQVLTFQTSDHKWHPVDPSFPALALSDLSDVAVTEGSGINGYSLVWNNADGKWEAAHILTSTPAFLALPDVSHTGAANGWVPVYNSAGPGVHFVDPATLITVGALNQVGDVAYPTGGAGAISTGAYLQWNGASWVPSTSAVTISVESLSDGPGGFSGKAHQFVRVNSVETTLEYHALALSDLVDVSVTEGAGIDGYVLAWNNGTGKWQALAHASNALSSLTDVSVAEGAGIDGWVLAWKNADGKWEAKQLSAVAVSGAYADLTGRPSLAAVATSGAYADLSGRPSLAAVATSGAYSDLTGLPSLFSGAYADLSGRPTIPTTIETLTDVQVSSLSAGQVLAWSATDSKWENVSLSAVISSLAGLTDVSVTEGSGVNGYVLYWNNGTGKWSAEALSAVALSGAYSDLTGRPSLATVATSGAYSDLTGRPSLATVATSGAFADLTGKPTNATYALSGLSDVSVTEGAGIDGYYLKWDNGTGKWVAAAVTGGGGGSGTLAGDTDVAITSPTDGQALVYDAATSKWVNGTVSGGGGGGGGGLVETPPLIANLTAYQHLGGSTLTQRTTGCVPSLSVVPAGSDGYIYLAMEAAPSGPFSLVCKSKVAGSTNANNWHGAGIAFYNSANDHIASTMFNGANTLYPLDWSSLSSCSIRNTLSMADADFYQHLDYDGTIIKFGVSRNGVDVWWYYTENMVAAMGAITHVGIAWYGNNSYPYEFQHYHVGALGTSGLTVGGGGGGGGSGSSTLAGDTDVAITSPANGDVLTYDSGTSKWKNAPASGGGVLENYSAGSTSVYTLGSAPIPATAIPNCSLTITAAAASRVLNVFGNVTWGPGYTGHAMRVAIYLDGTQVWPAPGGTTEGIVASNTSDGDWVVTIAGVPVTIPGDNATHTLAFYWSASGSTGGFDLKGRNIFAMNAASAGIGSGSATYDIAAFLGGTMANSENLLGHVPPIPIQFDAAKCKAKAITAATGSAVVTIKVNGTSIGTIAWVSSGTVGTFSFTGSTTVSAGDLITLVAPGLADASLADVAVTLAALRI